MLLEFLMFTKISGNALESKNNPSSGYRKTALEITKSGLRWCYLCIHIEIVAPVVVPNTYCKKQNYVLSKMNLIVSKKVFSAIGQLPLI